MCFNSESFGLSKTSLSVMFLSVGQTSLLVGSSNFVFGLIKIVYLFCQLLDERQSNNVLRFLQAINRYNVFPISTILSPCPHMSNLQPCFPFCRRPDITEGLKRLRCRTLIFIGDSSPFHSEALHMISKLDRRYSALVEVWHSFFQHGMHAIVERSIGYIPQQQLPRLC